MSYLKTYSRCTTKKHMTKTATIVISIFAALRRDLNWDSGPDLLVNLPGLWSEKQKPIHFDY